MKMFNRLDYQISCSIQICVHVNLRKIINVHDGFALYFEYLLTNSYLLCKDGPLDPVIAVQYRFP